MQLRRSFLTEIYLNLLMVSFLLLLIFLVNVLHKILSIAATNALSPWLVTQLIALRIPYLLGLLLPLSFYLSIITVVSRMHVESEWIIYLASGVSQVRLFFWLTSLTLLMFLLTLFYTLFIDSFVLKNSEQLMSEAAVNITVNSVVPDTFQPLPQNSIIYADDVDKKNKILKNVFVKRIVKDKDGHDVSQVIIAKELSQRYLKDYGNHYIYFTQGSSYQYYGFKKQLDVADFDHLGIRWQPFKVNSKKEQLDLAPLSDIWHQAVKGGRDAISIYYWRLSIPFSILPLSLVAFLLGQVKARSGKFASYLPAILIYLFYIEMIVLGRSWIEKTTLSPFLIITAVHASIFLIISMIYYWRSSYNLFKWRAG